MRIYIYIFTDKAARWVIGSLGEWEGPASQPSSQPATGPRSAEQEEQEQDTNEFRFALVCNSYARLSRASRRAFPV